MTDHRRQRPLCFYLYNGVWIARKLECTLAYRVNSTSSWLSQKIQNIPCPLRFKRFKCIHIFLHWTVFLNIKQLANKVKHNFKWFCREMWISPLSLISEKCKGYCCESDTPLYAYTVSLNVYKYIDEWVVSSTNYNLGVNINSLIYQRTSIKTIWKH